MTSPTTASPLDRHNLHARGREKLKAHLAVLLFALLLATSFSFGGIATRVMDPIALTALRYIVTVVVTGLICFKIKGYPLALPKRPGRFLIVGALMSTYMLSMFIALQFTAPVATGAIFTIMPLMSAGFGWILMRQRTRGRVLLSLSIAAIGAIWVIFQGDIHALLSFDLGKGEMIYLVGVTAHAIYVPLLRKFNEDEPALIFMFWTAVATLAFIMVPGAPRLLALDYASVPLLAWVMVIYLAVVMTLITFLLLQYAATRLPAPKVLAYSYLTPSFIIVLEGALGHGWAPIGVLAGALITAAGLVAMATLPD
ncbi:drug/metabolite transporter (DMT)-like permease [Agrobacterium vitis]|nr:drug/metabolite transporter (DMT)-like permease [Agrobacterium vitis]MBE1437022.1 drug/metabolite transporter (DMT)-like permease [Agrobacterium vitis]